MGLVVGMAGAEESMGVAVLPAGRATATATGAVSEALASKPAPASQ